MGMGMTAEGIERICCRGPETERRSSVNAAWNGSMLKLYGGWPPPISKVLLPDAWAVHSASAPSNALRIEVRSEAPLADRRRAAISGMEASQIGAANAKGW